MRPNYPFSYYFIDENFDQLYRSEKNLQRIFSCFAFLSVVIGCLGLFGLAAAGGTLSDPSLTRSMENI